MVRFSLPLGMVIQMDSLSNVTAWPSIACIHSLPWTNLSLPALSSLFIPIPGLKFHLWDQLQLMLAFDPTLGSSEPYKSTHIYFLKSSALQDRWVIQQ